MQGPGRGRIWLQSWNISEFFSLSLSFFFFFPMIAFARLAQFSDTNA